MRKLFLFALVCIISFSGCETAKNIMNSAGTSGNGNLSNAQVVQGLKEALIVGTDSATFHLGLLNGFYKDDMIKILMPPEAQNVEKTLRNVGLGSVVDKAVLSMNRAAEDATKYVGDIFLNAIKQMTIQDAFSILRGDDHAATNYLKQKTSAQLTAAFTPIVSKSLEYTNATKYWKEVFTTYNRFSQTPVNTDLTAYVTQKTLDGLFYHIGLKEQEIRKDPAARITDILKKVFANQ
ncbi:MAG TPA: DUF4197 domain-containing protein [Hanamia sp.]|nr:DUF4197 domain-containing protein [Hanamia sp.]